MSIEQASDRVMKLSHDSSGARVIHSPRQSTVIEKFSTMTSSVAGKGIAFHVGVSIRYNFEGV